MSNEEITGNAELTALADKVNDVAVAVGEIRERDGNIDTELRKATGELATTMQAVQKLEGQLRTEAERRDATEVQLRQLHELLGSKSSSVDSTAARYHEATMEYVKNGMSEVAKKFFAEPEIAELHRRTLNESNLTEGGILVSPTVEDGIIKDVVEMSPVMQVARVTNINTARWEKRRRATGPTAYWVGEEERPTESNSTYELVRIEPGIVGAATEASTSLLDDVSYIESEMTEDAAEAMQAKVGNAMVLGDGVRKPRGFTIPGSVPFVTAAGSSVAANDFYGLLYGKGGADESGLSARYRGNAAFAMNSNTLLATVILKDSNGAYIWQDGFRDGAFSRIAGRPYHIFEDMADDGSAGNLPVALADWRRFYRVVVRRGIYVLRDPYSAKPNVEFDWYWRVGGDVEQAEAGRLMKMQ